MDKYVKTLEALYPDAKWLARKLDGPSDVAQFGKGAGYMVHIYWNNELGDLVRSHLSAGSKLAYAFRGALALAAKHPTP